MNLDIKTLTYPMDPKTTLASICVVAVASHVAVNFLDSSSKIRVKACTDAYTMSNKQSWDTNSNFVKCMQGQFPDEFAASYKKKIESDSKLTDML